MTVNNIRPRVNYPDTMTKEQFIAVAVEGDTWSYYVWTDGRMKRTSNPANDGRLRALEEGTIYRVPFLDTNTYSSFAEVATAYTGNITVDADIAFSDLSGGPALLRMQVGADPATDAPTISSIRDVVVDNPFIADTTGQNSVTFRAWNGTEWSDRDIQTGNGYTPDTATLSGLGGASTGWYNLITWPAVTGADTSAVDMDLHLVNTTGDAVITFGIDARTVRGITSNGYNNSISLSGVIEQGSSTALYDTQFRVITTDETDVNAPIALQMNFDSGEEWSGLMVSKLAINYGLNVNFGAGTLHSDTPNQAILSEIQTGNWRDQYVVQGTSGGIAASSIGSHSNEIAWIDFLNESVDIHADEVTIGRFSPNGTRMSAGEYGTWTAPKSVAWPIDASFWTNMIAEKRLTSSDTSLNPSSTVTAVGINTGGTNAETMTGFNNSHRGLRFTTTAGTRGVSITFENCLYQTITFTAHFGVGTSSGGATQDYEVIDSDGNQVAEWTILGPDNNVGTMHTFDFTFEAGAGNETYVIRKRSTGTSQAVYLYDYDMDVAVVEPALEDNVVVQMDSPLRGALLPRILPSSSITHPVGSMALNGLAGNRPIWHDGNDWAYINTTRSDYLSLDQGQFFFAESGTLNDAGWTGSNHQRLPKVDDYQGFPSVIRCTQSGGTITIQAPNNTQALWDIAKANGFRVDYRIMFGATHDGQVWLDLEPNNISWGANGRFEASVQVNSGQLELVMINSGGNTSVPLERDVMHTISMIQNAGSDIAEMHVEGKKVGEVTYGGGGSNERGTFFYIPPGNAVNDFAIQSITTYTVPAADRDVTLDKTAILTGERYNVPNINSPTTIRVPKGLYDLGNTFTIVNGSTEIATVSGLADDHQLFGGSSTFDVLPQKEVTFTQTSFPRGNVWAVEGGKTVINHEDIITPSTGNSLILTIDSAGTILGRHGTYLGDDVTVSRTATGMYTITVTSALFDDTTSVLATPKHTADQQMTCNYAYTLGEVIVDVLQAGTAVNDSFCVSIYW